MDMIPRRKRLHPSEAWMLETTRQYEMTVDPPGARHELRERHPDLERDAGLLRQHTCWSHRLNRKDERIEQLSDLRGFPREVMREIMPAARMRLIAVRE